MYKLVFAFVSMLFLLGAPASASTTQDKWLVTQLSGDARLVHPGLQPASVHVQSELAPGDTLVTGPTGRATLVRGADYIVVAPRSELRLPATPQPTGFTRVIQDMGTLLFKVQHTGIPHFAVDTPMLAAVVKGTTFTVVVDQQRSAVQVIQGVVQVSAVNGGMSRMVEGGRTVFIDRVMPKVLLDADKPVPATNAPSSGGVRVSATADTPLATMASLTGGLVRADLAQTTGASNATNAPPLVQTAQTGAQPSVGSGSANGPSATTPGTSAVGGGTTTAAPATTPPVTTPAVTVVPATTPTATITPVTTPPVTVAPGPPATTPAVTIAPVTTPAVTVAPVATPVATVPTVSTPTVTTPVTTVPSVTVPSVTAPSVSIPAMTVPTVTTPTLTVPTVTAPVVPVTTPTITVPSVSTPSVSVPPPPPPPLPKF